MLCGYCHDIATFCCPNEECWTNSRAYVCKACSPKKMRCIYCGEKLIEEDELVLK